MASFSHQQHTSPQIIERCTYISLDDLLSRGANAHNPIFKHLASAINSAAAYDCGAHLLEWPDGLLVLVISHGAREFSQLSADTVIAAHGFALRGSGLIYREGGGIAHVA